MTEDCLHDLLVQAPVSASAPCRIDMGGTLDISTFYLPLRYLNPCTVNLALSLRTRVSLSPFDRGWVKVSSRGFEEAVFALDEIPFRHPMGLMLAIAAFFRAGGVHIQIDSASPVRSALGGSSVAAVALIAAFERLNERMGRKGLGRQQIALLAHSIEQSVAAVPCGIQDMLAAAFGGGHAWYWTGRPGGVLYKKRKIVKARDQRRLSRCLLVAYCGAPHESHDVNGQWVRQFLEGKLRSHWVDIIRATHDFVKCIEAFDLAGAGRAMNLETDLRCEMTPEVLDDIGRQLAAAAREKGCGARFTGAGGGGCMWALGSREKIEALKPDWEAILVKAPEAGLLDAAIDSQGVL